MSSLIIEVTGDYSATVDEATSTLLEQFAQAGVAVMPAKTSSERDGGVIALAITIAGGAASIAQIVSTIHGISKKKEVQIVIINRSGVRTSIDPAKEPTQLQALIQQDAADP